MNGWKSDAMKKELKRYFAKNSELSVEKGFFITYLVRKLSFQKLYKNLL